MKKKFLAFALTGMLALSALTGLAACKPDQGGTSGPQGNGSTNNDGGTIKPGTVITDETLKSSIVSALARAEIEGLTFTGSASLALTGEEQRQKVELEGALLLGERAEGDVCLLVEGESVQYLLSFLRTEGVFSVTGESEKEQVDFNALKEQLKDEEEPLVLEKSEGGTLQKILAAPAAVKLLKNATTLFDGVAVKTEGGYSLTFDLFSGLSDLLAGAEEVAEVIDKTADMTLSGLFGQKFVTEKLTALFNGITAKELAPFIGLLPEGLQTALPEPDGPAAEYLTGLLRSGSFYTAVTGGEDPWSQYTTFGEMPLAKLVEFVTGGETQLSSLKLKNLLHDFREGLENKTVALLSDIFSLGEVTEGKAELALAFSFDNDKKLLGFTLDALAEGTLNAQPQPDDGIQPEDGQGDQMTAATSQTVRMSAKLAATCAKSPALYDLAGSQYRGESGPVPIAR